MAKHNFESIALKLDRIEQMISLISYIRPAAPEQPIDHPKPITPAQIIAAVSEWEGVAVDAIMGRSRLRRIARARFIAVYIIRHVLSMSLQEISDLFAYKHHGSALHAIRQIDAEMSVDTNLRNAVMGYMEKLKTPPQP